MHLEKQDGYAKIADECKCACKRGKYIMKIVKGVLPFFILAAVLLVVVGLTTLVKAKDDNGLIADNVYIGDTSVGGMTQTEAEEAVDTAVKASIDANVVLSVGEKSITVSSEDLGLQWSNTDVVTEALDIGKTGSLIERYKEKKNLQNEKKVFDIEYAIDATKVADILTENSDQLNQAAVDSELVREDEAFQIIEGQEGIEVDVDASVEAIQNFVATDWTGADASITLVTKVVEPKGTKEELEKVQDCLGSFYTDFSSSAAGRAANVKLATSKINGTVIYPGEEFSVYDTIAPLDATNGYELAGAYENGVTVESYGGGVCQVSTTLYNAVIRAELEITQRSNHSMLVTYVQPSMDAAIAGTYKNLKFKNSTEAPIYIEGYTSGGCVYFNVYGEETRAADRVVSFESETVSEEDPTVQVVATADPIGTVTVTQQEHIGKTAKLWKVVTVDGVEQSREVFNTSKYSSAPKIISVGTASDNADAVAAINVAIATQDEATVNVAAADWCSDAVAARAAQAQADAAAAAQAAEEATVIDNSDSSKEDDDKTKEEDSTKKDDKNTDDKNTEEENSEK